MSHSAKDINVHATSTIQQHQLGYRYEDERGDIWRYAKVGASTITKGKLQVAPAPKTNHHNVAVASAAALGATEVTVTLGNTAAVADEYAEGMLVINDVDGEGEQYRIKGHPAANASASLTVTLAEPIRNTALTTSSEVSLVHNRWNGVVEAAVKTRRAAGVPGVGATTGLFVWLKTKGVAGLLADQTITLGAQLCASGSVAGAVIENSDVTAPQTEVIVGFASVMAGVDTEFRPMELTID